MKTNIRLITYIIASVMPVAANAQCVDQLQSITHDTVVSGSGNGYYTFTFPKFNAPTGTLVDVQIRSEVTLIYNFQLENKENFTVNNYRVRVSREQEITSDALMDPLTQTNQRTYGYYSLAANDNVTGSGPDFTSQGPLYVMDDYVIQNTVNNTADFMGQGNVSFNYSSLDYSTVFGSVNYNFNGTAQDELHFSVTYRYCPSWFLNADITSFTAVKNENDLIDIQWITHNEKINRKYELQISTDGRRFVGVAQFAAKTDALETGTYTHQYRVQSREARKLIFRLKQVEQDGAIKYSPIRIVEFNDVTSGRTRIYPNPSIGPANLQFNSNKRGNWDVDIYSLSGQLIKRYRFTNVLLAQVNTNGELNKGMYMVKAMNIDTQEMFIERLTVQ